MKTVPRNEHPRPDLCRADYISLNGEWEFEVDNECVGVASGFEKRAHLDGMITVPFCPESSLSGVCRRDFMRAVWYRRELTVPENFGERRVILHIDAADYFTRVYINGECVGTHKGGYTPMAFDITDSLRSTGNYITVCVEDDILSMTQPAGKQSRKPESYGCYYTRHTGIWQSVWLEGAESARVISYKTYPSVASASVTVDVRTTPDAVGGRLTARALYGGRCVGSAEQSISSAQTKLYIPLSEAHLWEPGHGRLYDLEFITEKGEKTDTVRGYFGLREISLHDGAMHVNGVRTFGRFVLDQGYYPDGIVTAPTDEALAADIESALLCGFNGARLHQKAFEPRFLYHADRLGYMVFGEFANWGLDHTSPENIYNFLPEWLEVMERDFSHPAIIGWCPFNETWDIDGRVRDVRLVDTVWSVTKALDPTRIVIADSGSFPVTHSDAHDIHDYEQDAARLASNYKDISQGIVRDQLYRKYGAERQWYRKGEPIFISEWGGIKWIPRTDEAEADKKPADWGYGKDVESEEEFFARLSALVDVIYGSAAFFAACYTQLYDIELEKNGFMTYDRKFKFPPEKFRAVISRPSVIE